MPGTTTPEHEPFEHVTDAQRAVGVHHGDVRGGAQPRAHLAGHRVERVLGEEALEVALAPSPSRKSSSRARLVEAITSAIASVAGGRSMRSSMPSASAIRIPPEDGGGLVSTSRPR